MNANVGASTGTLNFSNVSITIPTRTQTVRALQNVSLQVHGGEVVGLVGESGGGKSVLARAALGMVPYGTTVTGTVEYGGTDVFTMDQAALEQHRGSNVAMCFQNPKSALEPLRTVRNQIADRLRAHKTVEPRFIATRCAEVLNQVGIVDVDRVLSAYPHELSGGMAQRVMIALALACEPGVLLADEPTTGLDVTLTRDALALLRELADTPDRGVLLISHDIAAISQICDRMLVIERGRIIESGPTEQIINDPQEQYTKTLLAAVPSMSTPLRARAEPPSSTAEPVVSLSNMDVTYRGRLGRRGHQALRNIDLQIYRGETVGVVGESGSGKSTLARVLIGMLPPDSGSALVDGIDLHSLNRSTRKQLSRHAQMVFQDPVGALNPRRTVLESVSEPLEQQRLSAAEKRARATSVLERVGLGAEFLDRYRHQISGGQAQRVGIARALVGDPSLIVFDEPTSALDVTVQAQILSLIEELAESGNRTHLFISHDLATVRSFCDRVVVVYRGEIVESGTAADVFENPQAEYTKTLLAATPRLGSQWDAAVSQERI